MDYSNSDFNSLSQSFDDSNQETLKWLQSTYLIDSESVDSGIQSAAQSGFGSKTLTVQSLDDDMETDAFSQDLLEGQSDRFAPSQSSITTSVLSEMIEENRHLTQLQPRNINNRGNNNNKNALNDFVGLDASFSSCEPTMNNYSLYEPEEQMGLESTNVVPGLITLLNDEDEVVVSQAMTTVFESAQRDDSRHAIMSNHQMVSTIARVMTSGHDKETTKIAAKTLHHLSHHERGLHSICRSGSIAALVKLLEEEFVLFYAITTLHNLLLHDDSSKVQIRAADGVRRMVMLLRKDNEKFLTVVTDCLQLLTFRHQESKLIMLRCNGPAELIRIIQSYNYEKLLWTSTRVLKVLSVCPSNKQALIGSGGMQALNRLLKCSTNYMNSPRLLQCVLWTLRNLSDAATKLEGLEDLLESLVGLLQVSDDHINITCTVGILSNLTCYNHMNKQIVCQVGGVEALLWTIHNASRREDITEPAICALRHLTSKSSESAAAQCKIICNDGIGVIMSLFNASSSWPVIKAIIGFFRNLSQNSNNYEALREHGVVSKVTQLFIHVYQMVREHKNNYGTENLIENGVRMEELMEILVSTLLPLVRDHENKNIIKSQHVHSILNELVYTNSNSNVQRVATDIMHELEIL